ncbi:hypothetical protein JG688_00008439 [Phytophthora aleatoria]|uniref:Uncharacterized protein n=1 Tax=Phytophthora aleatoria TaxID=2496075 RepID=A0A8J5M7E2_9STRA|nr:hypothetical protein JG688_00008439 [Phytophthora aleatoria]
MDIDNASRKDSFVSEMTGPDCPAYRIYGIAGAKRTPPNPSHLKNHRIPDRPHAASKNGNLRPSCELTIAGWSSKRPTGLSDEHTYPKPEMTKKDTRGKAYFVGEEERKQYLNKCDLAAIVAKKKARHHTATSPAERSQHRPQKLPATVSSPPRSLGKTLSGIVGVSPHDTTFHTASDLAASSQVSDASHVSDDEDGFEYDDSVSVEGADG